LLSLGALIKALVPLFYFHKCHGQLNHIVRLKHKTGICKLLTLAACLLPSTETAQKFSIPATDDSMFYTAKPFLATLCTFGSDPLTLFCFGFIIAQVLPCAVRFAARVDSCLKTLPTHGLVAVGATPIVAPIVTIVLVPIVNHVASSFAGLEQGNFFD
jgi:hypothetical protein